MSDNFESGNILSLASVLASREHRRGQHCGESKSVLNPRSHDARTDDEKHDYRNYIKIIS